MIDIGPIKGYRMFYDPKEHIFRLLDTEENEVASAPTQAELEKKAGELSRQSFKLPIPAALTRSGAVDKGRITSVSIESQSVYFVEDNRHHTKTKIKFPYGHRLFELTELNEEICTQVEGLINQRKELGTKIEELISQLEKPIDRDYFGMKERW